MALPALFVRRFAVAGLAGAICLAVATPVFAGRHAGCSAEASGWFEIGTHEAAELIWASVVAKDAFGDVDGLAAALAGLDVNGDGDLCLLRLWGEDLNPNSHWYKVGLEIYDMPITANYLRDNTANAADG